MKNFLMIIFCMTLLMPLYAQNNKDTYYQEKAGKKSFAFSRQHFEVGFDAGVGFDNDLIGAKDIFTKNIVIDLDNFGDKVELDGLHINADVLAGFFVNINMQGKRGFGFSSGVDGSIYGNLPKSLFTLITEGNINSHVFTGTTNVSGGVYYNTSLNGFVRFGNLKLGIKPSMYIPIMYIPKNSGITYTLDTEEGIKLDAEGEINIYTPFNMDNISYNPEDIYGASGFDISLEGVYTIAPIIEVGLSLSHIPLVASKLRYVNRYNLEEFSMDLNGDDLMNGGLEFPKLKFESESEECVKKVYRPLRFDTFALIRPLSFNLNLLVLKPSAELLFDLDDKTYIIGAGLEVQSHLLRNMIFLSFGTKLTENIWKHNLAFALNLRAFELDLGVALRSQSKEKSFQASGTEVNVGMRFGW